MKEFILLVALLSISAGAVSATKTTPCSKNKGISHCGTDGEYVCKDGEIIKDKKFCVGHEKKTSVDKDKKSKKTFKDM